MLFNILDNIENLYYLQTLYLYYRIFKWNSLNSLYKSYSYKKTCCNCNR